MNALVQLLTLLGIAATALLSPGLRPVWLIPAYGALALAAMLSGTSKRDAPLNVRAVPCLAVTTLFFGYILWRILFSPVEDIARPDLLMVLGGLIVYFVTALRATSPAARLVFAAVFFLLATAHIVVGAIQFTKGNNFMPFEVLPRNDYGARASGFYGCPNHLAGFLEVILCLSLSIAIWSRWRLIGKMLAAYTAVTCVAGLLMSGSRGGYASAAAGLFAFAVLSLQLARHWLRRDVWALLVTLLVFAGIGLSFLAYSLLHKSEFLSFRVQSAGADIPLRVGFWRAALQQFSLSPLFGTGSGTYLYFGRQFRESGVTQDPIYVHNDYLQLLAEYGLTALAGVAAFITIHLRSGWKFIADIVAGRTEEAEREGVGFYGDNSLALAVGAVCGICALLVHSIGDFNLHIPANTLVVAFLFGLLANPFSALRPDPKAGSPRQRIFLRGIPWTLPALGLWLACVSLPRWPAEKRSDQAQILLSDWHSLEDKDVARRAADLARQAIARDPKIIEPYFSLADSCVALAEMEDDPRAREDYYRQVIDAARRGLQIAPRETRFILALVHGFDALGEFEKSAPFLQRALELDPNNGNVLMEFGAHFHLSGKFDEAEIWYRKAMAAGFGTNAEMNLRRLDEDRKAAAPTAR